MSAAAPTAAGPLSLYRARRRAGQLAADPAQELAAEKLQSLHHALLHYQPASGPAGWRERLGLARRRDEAPQGLYIFGGVGRGKSMLMDLFFASAPIEKKRRVHFHDFMLEVHDRLHRQRQDGRSKAIRWRRWRPRSPPSRGCSASTSSMSPTSPMR